MMILALDGSTSCCSVALISAGRTVREKSVEVPRGRGGGLFSALQEILEDSAEIQRVVVGIGPGSYNGIRSAMAVAWGIASTRDIPVTGISSLLGLEDGDFCAVGDARRGQFYFAEVNGGCFVHEPALFRKEDLLREVANRPGFPIYLPSPIDFLPQALVLTPDAARLGRIAAREKPTAGAMPEPIYLKAAHITSPTKKSDQLNSG